MPLGAVHPIFAAALATGDHLLVQLKDNQAHLLDAAHAITARAVPTDTAASTTIGRSRHERRSVEVFPVGKALAETEWAPFINTIIRVTRRTWLRCAATGMWDQRGEVACYVSSAAGLQASAWADIIRGHWSIENRNHYVRDVSANEDRSRIRNNLGIIARARSFALNILRHNGVTNIAQALWAGALNLNLILTYKAI
jgi:predicted transposase YbfD/YdcC